MADEQLKLAVYIDFDNIQIGVKDTLGRDFDVSLVLEALKERGEVVTKVAYGDWPRSAEQSRQMTQHAVQMVQRNVTPRGDKNGADINLALDALEMAFTRHHINTFAIVGGDSDFIALVEKLKQYDKRVYVVGGRSFTSNILQRNCTEFIAYENLLEGGASGSRAPRRGGAAGRGHLEAHSLSEAFPNVQRALKILAEREVAPQIGLLKSTLLQLDSTFSERDYGAASFLEFMQKMERAHLVHLRRTDRGFLAESADADSGQKPRLEAGEAGAGPALEATGASEAAVPQVTAEPMSDAEALQVLRLALGASQQKLPNRPLYLRQVRQALRTADRAFDERRLGARGVHDLLQKAQREGLVRLERDRKGVLRIFPVALSALTSTPEVPAPPEEPTALPTGEFSATEPVVSEPTLVLEEAAPLTSSSTEEPAVGVETPAARRPRKPRAGGASTRGTRRKRKEPAAS